MSAKLWKLPRRKEKSKPRKIKLSRKYLTKNFRKLLKETKNSIVTTLVDIIEKKTWENNESLPKLMSELRKKIQI